MYCFYRQSLVIFLLHDISFSHFTLLPQDASVGTSVGNAVIVGNAVTVGETEVENKNQHVSVKVNLSYKEIVFFHTFSVTYRSLLEQKWL
jgi:hypothetical protein